jgi:hypothetical protein
MGLVHIGLENKTKEDKFIMTTLALQLHLIVILWAVVNDLLFFKIYHDIVIRWTGLKAQK